MAEQQKHLCFCIIVIERITIIGKISSFYQVQFQITVQTNKIEMQNIELTHTDKLLRNISVKLYISI